MSVEGALFGVSRTQQTLLAGVLGLALLGYALLAPSMGGAPADPLSLAVGIVMAVHAAVVTVHGFVLE